MVFVRRRAVLLVAAVLVVLALTRVGTRSGGAHPATRRPAPAFVTVQAGSPGETVPFGFLGLSLEYPSVERYAGTDPAALDPVFLQLVRNLTPGQAPVLRIGGDSTDRTWWPTPALARPPGVKYAITARWLAVTRGPAPGAGGRPVLRLDPPGARSPLAPAPGGGGL